MANPVILVVSGISGGGKTTLVDYALANIPTLRKVITTTTRAPGPNELEEHRYNFTTPREFQQGITRGDFIEHARVYGNYYGSSRAELDKVRANNLTPIYVLDVQGAKTIKNKLPESELVFIKTSTLEELAVRLRKRRRDSDEEIARRLEEAENELKSEIFFDYTIVNDDFRVASRRFVDLIRRELA